MSIVETFLTFGVQYSPNPQHDDKRHPLGMHRDGYAVIEAPTRELAREIANAIFGRRWAFDYDERPAAKYAPAGELLRIAWIQPATPAPRVLHRPTHVTEQLEQVEVA